MHEALRFSSHCTQLEGLKKAPTWGRLTSVWREDFATLARRNWVRNVKLTLEQQEEFVRELPEVFITIAGGWADGHDSHLSGASERRRGDRSLRAAWMQRKETKTSTKRRAFADLPSAAPKCSS